MSIKRVVLRIAIIILVIETLIMLGLGTIDIVLSTLEEAILDTTLLVLLSTPLIYIWVIRPYNIKHKKEQEFLFKSSRMAQMGEMISMLAHQWRQPLAAITANTINTRMMIELEKFDLEDVQSREEFNLYILDHLAQINEYVQNLSTTINDFRDFYKPEESTVIERINIPVQKALSIVQGSFTSNNIEVIEDYQSQVSLELHENEMMQVILNLMKNAQDNFKEKTVDQPKIFISTRDENEKAILEVCDNGGGIPEEIQMNIFDPYFSTKHEKNGTGLGLYMNKIIVETHHEGRISVSNNKEGACFRIELSGG